MAETLFEELKRYVHFGPSDEEALRSLYPVIKPEFARIAEVFYARILEHDEARTALQGGEAQVGHLKITLQGWMEKLFNGPWDQEYYELRARIGRVHVRIALPQHYMLAAMNVVRTEMNGILDRTLMGKPDVMRKRAALAKVLDLDLAIMLHTYREDLLAKHARIERLSTFGQLVGSIGHELRNPLGVMETSLYILKGKLSGDERVSKHLERISDQLKIANDIITQLLDMIRERPLLRQPVALVEVVGEAVHAVKLPERVKVSVEGLSALPAIEADSAQLRQVFLNLVENAVQAVSPDGEVWVQGREQPRGVEVSVEDSGPGVDPSIRARLFEPLVTTKPKGIGLGLALVKRIVERHGGSITYETGRTGGARFVVRLPLRG
ncbi:MAG: histidine kinase [Myxococcales bacterium]|nr:histidine kinase [Myxococcales bacterium]